jgi:hypothetical protein
VVAATEKGGEFWPDVMTVEIVISKWHDRQNRQSRQTDPDPKPSGTGQDC